ncbi:MAG: DNA repair protein RadA [Christensenellales bacterium]|jgi:DNA repair protein RadA/Sms
MAKNKTIFVCGDCGHENPGWLGKCPGCGAWNTFVEELFVKEASGAKGAPSQGAAVPIRLSEVQGENMKRLCTGYSELDRVLGGGIVPGSVVLLGGDPGIGKSTLLLQAGHFLSAAGQKVLYIAGEESPAQIRMRAQRIGAGGDCYILAENNLDAMESSMAKLEPDIIIADSVQTLYRPAFSSSPGSVGQVRESAAFLLRVAKTSGAAVFLVGHVTKEGGLAGPRVLEHMVDTVLYFEGERNHSFRILRAAKNRFGSTNEIGIFEMREDGMAQVEDASAVLLAGRAQNTPGTAVVCSMEGSRPLLVELQALISKTVFGMPRRNATGLDYNRMILLMAVLEKKVGMSLYNQDGYLNVVGGIKLSEPAADLGIVMSIASSYRNIPLPGDAVLMGEVGLSGEVRPIGRIEQRIAECAKLGFKRCMIPAGNQKGLKDMGVDLIGVSNLGAAMDYLL